MDIQVSSNFERLLFDLAGQDGTALAEQMKGFEANRAMRLTNAQRAGAEKLFFSARIDGDDMSIAMRWANDDAAQLIDSHTSVGLAPARLKNGRDSCRERVGSCVQFLLVRSTLKKQEH